MAKERYLLEFLVEFVLNFGKVSYERHSDERSIQPVQSTNKRRHFTAPNTKHSYQLSGRAKILRLSISFFRK